MLLVAEGFCSMTLKREAANFLIVLNPTDPVHEGQVLWGGIHGGVSAGEVGGCSKRDTAATAFFWLCPGHEVPGPVIKPVLQQ